MQMRSKAVVFRGENLTVHVEDILVDPPGPGEVMIKMAACGVCHSDLSVTNGTLPLPAPIVLGHEGAGVIHQVGPGVTGLKVGDHVISSFVHTCGKCRYCVAGRANLCEGGRTAPGTLFGGHRRTTDAKGEALNVMAACGVMAEYATLHENSVVKIVDDAPLDRCALIGCGVMTGWGAACNTAKVEPGSICVVFGAGGVGLSTIQGCQNAGATMIVAVDMLASKLEMAKTFGATHVVDASKSENLLKELRKLTGGGADYAFECVGYGEIVAQAYACLRNGGTAVAVGLASPSDTTTLRTASFAFEEKTLKGSFYGSTRPRIDFPRLVALYQAGKLKLDELITKRYRIEEAPQAFDDLAKGRNARGVIVFD
ncbi:Zn-dependent alcohol dehydrogenase [Variovorax sp. J22R133]|uniref:Zn-dependent alcohol dehydrogenase n=1 Tax=Variovorax brevis TaxID=3053503 RepID=UPI002578788E|nr:Zn-dependent alcohol dehydrogenase [Variovorax sp. J22R133]MDM0111206.1 Zn-dependent alcohol dehydrogenase [Variovorax sp. J22R133]